MPSYRRPKAIPASLATLTSAPTAKNMAAATWPGPQAAGAAIAQFSRRHPH